MKTFRNFINEGLAHTSIETGTSIKFVLASKKVVYGKVIKKIEHQGEPGYEVLWDNKTKGKFKASEFVSIMDDKADFRIEQD